jgi:hypothetical protein
MTDQTYITATRAPDGVTLTVHARNGDVVIRTTLEPKKAMSLGLDLCNLATEPLFRSGAITDPAGRGARPVIPPA